MRLLGLPPVLVVLSSEGPAIRWPGRGTGMPRAPRARMESEHHDADATHAPASRTILKSHVALEEGDFDFAELPREARRAG